MNFIMDYEELLKKAYEVLPKKGIEKARFELPKVKGHFEGQKTVVSNFMQVVDVLQRDSKDIAKFLLKELGTAGEIVKTFLAQFHVLWSISK